MKNIYIPSLLQLFVSPTQSSSLVLPDSIVVWPSGHSVQLVCPAQGWKLPGEHGVHISWPVMEYDPAAQGPV